MVKFANLTNSVGGQENAVAKQTTEIYNINTNSTAYGPNLIRPSYDHCAVHRISTNTHYIIGGVTFSLLDERIYSYNIPAGGPIQTLTGTMSVGKARLGCLVLDTEGKILAAQGISVPSWSSQPTSEIYDISMNLWTSVPYLLPWFPLPAGIHGPRMIAMQGTLGAVFTEPGATYIYDKATGHWNETLNSPYKGHNRNVPIAIGLMEFKKCRPSWGP